MKRPSKKPSKKKSNISNPLEVQHLLHIDRDLNWSFDKAVDPNTIFTKIKDIGQGGYGSVFELMHTPSSTLLAGKSINADLDNPKSVKAIKKEIDLMRQIVSDYTIHYYGMILFQNRHTILMEFCNLGSFRDLVDYRNEVLTENQIAIVMHDLLNALLILHEKYHIVHRDIKAANILLASNGYCRVTDFGVSRQFSQDTMTTKSMMGTPYWMAPEVINEEKYDYKADVWSTGATAIELAIGAPPYIDFPPTRAMVEIATNGFAGAFPYEDEFSKEFVNFIQNCVIVDTTKRPAVKELLEHPFIKRADALDRMEVLSPLLKTQVDFAKLLEMANEEEGEDFQSKTKSFIRSYKTKKMQTQNS